MNLNDTQKDLLRSIQFKLRQGDIKAISEGTGLSREYVSRVLSPNYDAFHENIVKVAVEIISKREQNTKKLLNKLTE